MFCKNCGAELMPNANVCTHCGVPVGLGNHFCPQCANATSELAAICVKCGYQLGTIPYTNSYPASVPGAKSKLVAGLLGILLGSLGIHNFYLGYTNRAVIQLVLTLAGGVVTCGLSSTAVAIWALVEGIQILTGTINCDANGIPLKD